MYMSKHIINMSIGGCLPMLMMIGCVIIFLNIFETIKNKGEWCTMKTITNLTTCIYSIIGNIITIYSAQGVAVSYRF